MRRRTTRKFFTTSAQLARERVTRQQRAVARVDRSLRRAKLPVGRVVTLPPYVPPPYVLPAPFAVAPVKPTTVYVPALGSVARSLLYHVVERR